MDKDKLEARAFGSLTLGFVLFVFDGILIQLAKSGVISEILIPISVVVFGISAALILWSLCVVLSLK